MISIQVLLGKRSGFLSIHMDMRDVRQGPTNHAVLEFGPMIFQSNVEEKRLESELSAYSTFSHQLNLTGNARDLWIRN